MIKIMFLACLSVDPEVCEEKSLVYVDVPIMACVVHAQSELAKWNSSHPQWTIQRWKCQAVVEGIAEL